MSESSLPLPIALPQPRHLARLPAGLQPEDWLRIRQAAFMLPQVLSPLDFDGPEQGREQRLDALGLILIQKAVAGARPSRWIAPEDIPAALAHIDALGQAPTHRTLMLKRANQLDALAYRRDGLRWQRQCRELLELSRPGWTLPLAFHEDIPAAPIWAFFRDGDTALLDAALGPTPAYPEREPLRAALEALLARSSALAEDQLDTLLPRLQAECVQPQPLAELLAACQRAQARWELAVAEQHTLARLTHQLAFQGYPDSFPLARRLKRQVTLFVGPPNSGKTHAAFERLAQARSGAYLAPLRLLALEGRDRLVARGLPCSLLTGEENQPAEGAHLVSSTIEMLGTGKPLEVAVIDEAQMLFDPYRGWAWTQAIVGAPAEQLLIICSAYAVPAIEQLLGLCGERCTVRHFERKQEVQLLPAAVPIRSLQRGDAVVAFSRRDVLMLRDQIAAEGHPVSVIYGALPPEVRRREAERFAQGASHILVATDAIGMGLNLPIRRVLFSTMSKFDGEADRPLSVSETHQIAGRAGRYGLHDEGFCGVLREAEPSAARQLRELLPRAPRAPREFKAAVAPNWWHVQTIAEQLQLSRLRAVLGVFVDRLRLDNAHFAVAELEQMLELAEQLDHVAPGLSLRDRFIYAQAPVDTRTVALVQEYLDWAAQHARRGAVGAPWFLDQVDGHSRLDRMEQALRSCTLWLWLDLRFPGVYGQLDAVLALRSALNDGIERQLKAKKPLWQNRRGR